MKHLLLAVCLAVCLSLVPLSGASFPSVEGKTFADQEIVFPDDLLSPEPIVVAITLSSSRKNGEEQQEEFIEWQKRLVETGSPLREVPIYHVAVIDGAPFFVRGAIRKGIAKEYEQVVEPSFGMVLFLSKAERFASEAGITIDGQPTLVVLTQDGTVKGFVKGAFSEESRSQLAQILGT
ncbi:MAG: hypothetical protein PHY87_09695 [Sphaerochaeta sp.]|nr:hypothetical protein [Sphaerochaeta sp.]